VSHPLVEYPGVILGKDNWLFSGDPINDAVQSGVLDDAQIKQVVAELQYVNDSLKEAGVHFLFLLIPDKHLIYDEFMPDTYRNISIPSSYDRLSEALSRTDIDFIDAKPLLLEKKQETGYRLYYMRDLNWNSLGNFYVIQEILAHLRQHYPVPEMKLLSVDTDPTRVSTGESSNDLNNLMQSLAMWQEKGAPEPVYAVQSENKTTPILWYGDCFSPEVLKMMQEILGDDMTTYVALWEKYGFPHSFRADLTRRVKDNKVVVLALDEHYRQKIVNMLVPEPPKIDFTEYRRNYFWEAQNFVLNWQTEDQRDFSVENDVALVGVGDNALTPVFYTRRPLQMESSRRYYLVIKVVSPAVTGILVDFSRAAGTQDNWTERQGQHIYEGNNTLVFEIPQPDGLGLVKKIRFHLGDKPGIYGISQVAIYSKDK